ncbi:glutaredoxin family protein [Leuconostoc citreum]|uniref:glutaredoxin family protein n=1 Tax=Leuconostoc citreum TaxID=33964 RepID=UPI0022E4BDAD|nr:thioredoxin family protein [Leuconostoc citreum]
MRHLKKWGIGLSVLVALALATIAGGTYYYQTELNGYPDTKNFADKINTLSNHRQQKTVIVFHKPGCSDCKHARSTIKNAIKTHQKSIQYLVINVNRADAQTYTAKYGVTQVPTVIALQGDQVIDSTSSTNNNTIAKVAAGE